MLPQTQERIHDPSLRKPQRKRTNLIPNTSKEKFNVINTKTKANRHLSNITYKDVFGGE